MDSLRAKSCRLALLGALTLGLAGLFGCSNDDAEDLNLSPNRVDSDEEVVVPPDIKGTVAEVATMVSGGDAPISSWGVVIGLERNGSSETPPRLRSDLVKYLKGQIGIARPIFDTGSISVSDFLADPDTAVVRLDAVIPPGAPKNTRVDVLVSAWPRTQTTSLAGGMLLPRELHWSNPPGGTRGRYLKPLARAEGGIFVNPFLNPENPKDAVRLRQGRVLGGARVIEDMPIRLQLRQPDYLTSNILQKRINFRFAEKKRDKVANAKTRYYVDITIPQAWREDYEHFLQLILHLPLRGGAHEDARTANRIARAMQQPTANHDGLALVWEAMGRQIVPTVQKLYSSETPAVAFYSARTGLRLGDRHLAGPVVLRFARTTRSPFQLEAIAELGRHSDLLEAGPLLEQLLDDRNELVRITAYHALIDRGNTARVRRQTIDPPDDPDERPSFYLDEVDSAGAYVIYATRTLQPRLVLLGKNMPVATPIFFESPDGLVRIFNEPGDPQAEKPIAQKPHLVVLRRLKDGETMSEPFRIPFRVEALAKTLGARPRPDMHGNIQGLGLTYSQVVGVLQQLCKENCIQAKFVLQPLENVHTMYRMTPSVGRPDQPER